MPGRAPVHLFTGAVFAPVHEDVRSSNTPKWVCSKCRNKIPKADLERFAEQRQGSVSPDAIAEHLGEADATIQGRVPSSQHLRESRRT